MQRYRENGGLRRHILVVDDEPINREILGNLLCKDYEVHYAENGKQALDILQEKEYVYSLILLDLLMPVMDGFELIEILKDSETLRSIPVIVMTSEKDAEVKSIKMGAADFITKPYDMPEVILARCERIIELQEDKTIINAAEKDHLTGLYTKDFFTEYIRQIEKYNPEQKMDLIVLNIEHFHLINELYGHAEGDKHIISAANIIRDSFKEIGTAYRTGGVEFIVFAHDCDEAAVRKVLNCMEEATEIYNNSEKPPIPLQIAYGYAHYSTQADMLEEAEKLSDRRMYMLMN